MLLTKLCLLLCPGMSAAKVHLPDSMYISGIKEPYASMRIAKLMKVGFCVGLRGCSPHSCYPETLLSLAVIYELLKVSLCMGPEVIMSTSSLTLAYHCSSFSYLCVSKKKNIIHSHKCLNS